MIYAFSTRAVPVNNIKQPALVPTSGLNHAASTKQRVGQHLSIMGPLSRLSARPVEKLHFLVPSKILRTERVSPLKKAAAQMQKHSSDSALRRGAPQKSRLCSALLPLSAPKGDWIPDLPAVRQRHKENKAIHADEAARAHHQAQVLEWELTKLETELRSPPPRPRGPHTAPSLEDERNGNVMAAFSALRRLHKLSKLLNSDRATRANLQTRFEAPELTKPITNKYDGQNSYNLKRLSQVASQRSTGALSNRSTEPSAPDDSMCQTIAPSIVCKPTQSNRYGADRKKIDSLKNEKGILSVVSEDREPSAKLTSRTVQRWLDKKTKLKNSGEGRLFDFF